MKKIILMTLIITLLILCVVLTPVYQFMSHKDDLPLTPWGWLSLPNDMPSTNKIFDNKYSLASEHSMQALKSKRGELKSPSISAAVAIDSRLVWAGAVGWDDIKNEEPIEVTTRFRIGSSSKALNSLVLARLLHQEKIDLDFPIKNYLSEINPEWSTITPRQLASHMAGIPHYKENTEVLGLYRTIALDRHYSTMKEAMTLFDESDLVSKPGEYFHYSSLGTVLLGAVIEQQSGKDYYSTFVDEIANPLGIRSVIVSPVNSEGVLDMATFYKASHDSEKFRPWRDVDLSHRLPGGGFVASPKDLTLLASAMFDKKFINEDIVNIILQPQVLNNGEMNAQNYALGWRVATWKKDKTQEDTFTIENANHGGVSRGSQCWLMIIPDEKMAIAVAINRNVEHFWDFGEVSMEIAESFIKAKNTD